MYDIEKLRFWCQKVMPLVYEDSLSYYELLCKVVNKLNEVIKSVDGIPDLIAEMISDEHIGEIVIRLLNNIEEQIASANEELSETATADRVVGCFVWLNGDLYRATKYIDAGDRYVAGGNVEKITVEEAIGELYPFENLKAEKKELLCKPKTAYQKYLRSKNNIVINDIIST